MLAIDEAPQIAMEDGVIVRFWIKAVRNDFKTQQEGHPVFQNMEMIEIMLPGDNKTVINEIVKEHHRNRFPRSYKDFKEGTITAAQGYPIDKWDVLDPATKATLKYMHVPTVEALAELPDGVLSNLGMGAHEMREKARKHVKANYVDPQIAALRAEIAEMKAAKAPKSDDEDEPKRKGGRPRKVVDDLPPHMQG